MAQAALEHKSRIGHQQHNAASASFTPRKLPSPTATSTPPRALKDRSLNGLPNGVQNAQNSPTANAKRRKVAYMSDSDEDGMHGLTVQSASVKNGANGTTLSQQRWGVQAHIKHELSALDEQRKQLPIARGREALVRELRENDTIVLVGETGSGKTTQVPQYILEAGIASQGMIAVTQPRRVAATSLASRVAQEQNTPLGKVVGYSVRFDEAWSATETRIKFVTDGMLAREMHADSLLSSYSVIIIDEAHERTLNTDLLICNLKHIQNVRNGDAAGKGKQKATGAGNLKVIIMSATLDAEKFSRFYNNAKIVYVKGRQHAVIPYHTLVSQPDYVDASLRTFFQIHIDSPPGDVLIFLPGQEDIEGLDKAIKNYAAQLPTQQMQVVTCPLYAALPPALQAKTFAPTPPGARKCILATNIAETSITIPGVRYVIDSGKCKEKRHVAGDRGGGMDTLFTEDISKSSAMQRTGRAGREGKGWCFRLYTEADFNNLPMTIVPEIQRCSLTSSMLQLKCLGQDMETLDFMDKPEIEAIAYALKSLYMFGAIDNRRELTPVGRQMNEFPLEPPLSRALLAAVEIGCTSELIDIVSVLSSSSKLFFDVTNQRDQVAEARSKFRHPSGDHLTTLNAFRGYLEIAGNEGKGGRKEWCRRHFLNEKTLKEATNIRDQLRKICDRLGINWKASCGDAHDSVLRSLIRGLAQNTAMKRAEGYKQILGSSIVKIHPGSALSERKPAIIMYDELVLTGKTYARGVSAIQPELLSEVTAFTIRTAS